MMGGRYSSDVTGDGPLPENRALDFGGVEILDDDESWESEANSDAETVVDDDEEVSVPLTRSLSDGVFPSIVQADLVHRTQSVVRQAVGGPGRWERCDFEPDKLSILFVSIVGRPPPVNLLSVLPVEDLINNQPLAVIINWPVVLPCTSDD
jgi:hypothetical protein